MFAMWYDYRSIFTQFVGTRALMMVYQNRFVSNGLNALLLGSPNSSNAPECRDRS